MISQQLPLPPRPQESSQQLQLLLLKKLPLLPPQKDKRIIIHNQLQLLLPQPQELETAPQPQELLELHPQLAADKSLIEICLQMFVMVYHMRLRMSLFPYFAEEFLH